MNALIACLLVLTAVAGGAVALTRVPRRQVFAMSASSFVLSLLFMVLQAPDVALSEIAVGTVVLPLLFVVALASMRMDRSPPGPPPGTDKG